jgi:hypothetical protein
MAGESAEVGGGSKVLGDDGHVSKSLRNSLAIREKSD